MFKSVHIIYYVLNYCRLTVKDHMSDKHDQHTLYPQQHSVYSTLIVSVSYSALCDDSNNSCIGDYDNDNDLSQHSSS